MTYWLRQWVRWPRGCSNTPSVALFFFSVDTGWWPLIVSRNGVTPRSLQHSLLLIALVSPQALIHPFDGLAAEARAGALVVCMRVHRHGAASIGAVHATKAARILIS